jgi:hypothetical protein
LTYLEIKSNRGNCLNVDPSTDFVFMDSCVSGDHNELWYAASPDNIHVVFQNWAVPLNLTATGIFNGAELEVLGGPASPENEWLTTVL